MEEEKETGQTDDGKGENSYRNILKSTSLFGGVQVFQILIGLIRGKFVAMFLGAEGMGISALFASSTNTINQLATLGLHQTFVKEVAANKKDPSALAEVMGVALALLRITAIAGAIICAILAPWLSKLSFGSLAYSWQFVALGLMIFFTVEGTGKLALLQGLHRTRLIATYSVVGAVIGLLTGVPLYYFFGDKGIVPAMIILAFSTYLCFTIGIWKTHPEQTSRFSWKTHRGVVKRMVKFAAVLITINLISSSCTYAVNIFVRIWGNLADVGLFNAANSLTNQYAGAVFTAMAMDYFPRLTAVANDNMRMREVVNRQMEIVALIVTPCTILLIGLAPLVIQILLTDEFLPVTQLMRWMGLGMLFRALATPMGYISFAKSNNRLFFWLEGIGGQALFLSSSLIFYYFFGLIGLGYAVVAEQALCCVMYLAVNYKVYGYMFNRKASMSVLWAAMLGTAAFCCSLTEHTVLSYYLMAAVFTVSAAHSFLTLRVLLAKKDR